MDSQDLLSSEQAQQYLGVSRATLWKLIERYKIPRYQLPLRGKRIFLRREDLDRLQNPIRRNGPDEGEEHSRAA